MSAQLTKKKKRLKLRKLFYAFIALAVLIIAAESGYYFYLKNFKRNQKSSPTKRILQETTESQQDFQRSLFNQPQTLEKFRQCFLGENIDVPGFLIKASVVRVDTSKHKLTINCHKREIANLFFDESTRHHQVVKRFPLFKDGKRVEPLDTQGGLVSAERFYSELEAGEEIQMNIRETEGGYYIISITSFID